MIDIQRDTLISLSQLARRLPSTNGGKVNPATTFRWAVTGLRGHKLEVIHVGGRMLTTWEAYEQFAAAVASGRAPEPVVQSPRQVKRVRDARKILAEAGIG